MPKIVFFDIDGTLYSHTTGGIPESSERAISELRKKNVLVAIATGRHISEIQKLGIDREIQADVYVTLNGQFCYNDAGVIYANPIHQEDVDYTLDYLDKNPFPCMFLEQEEVYMNYHNELVQQVQQSIHSELPKLQDLKQKRNTPLYQIIPYFRNDEGEDYLKNLKHCKVTRWNVGAVDVIPDNGGKHIGIQKVLEYYGIQKEDALAFGDGENDIEMFQAVGTSVAMGNSTEAVKKYAKYVTDSVDEDGIWKYFNAEYMN